MIVDPMSPMRQRRVGPEVSFEDLLVPIFSGGKRVWDPPTLDVIRARREHELSRFHGGIKRFVHPHQYPVGLELSLFETKMALIDKARGDNK